MLTTLVIGGVVLLAGSLVGGRVHAATTHEWHTLAAAPGQLDAVHAGLRERVLPALGGRGLRAVAVFTPVGDNPDRLVHLVVAGSPEEAESAGADLLARVAEWQSLLAGASGTPALAASRSTQRLQTTAWSPLPAAAPNAAPRVFELRTYTSPDAAKRQALLKRFEHHTLKLFDKHGMTNVIYWTPAGGPEADTMLVYLLAHESPAAAKASFDAFRKDPDWVAAKTASEAAAGGSLTTKEKGVVSEFLAPTDYSPLR
jgi:hypothetical protein